MLVAHLMEAIVLDICFKEAQVLEQTVMKEFLYLNANSVINS